MATGKVDIPANTWTVFARNEHSGVAENRNGDGEEIQLLICKSIDGAPDPLTPSDECRSLPDGTAREYYIGVGETGYCLKPSSGKMIVG